jgi:hypothetical protein
MRTAGYGYLEKREFFRIKNPVFKNLKSHFSGFIKEGAKNWWFSGQLFDSFFFFFQSFENRAYMSP